VARICNPDRGFGIRKASEYPLNSAPLSSFENRRGQAYPLNITNSDCQSMFNHSRGLSKPPHPERPSHKSFVCSELQVG
jgi:hypothetical protein